MENLRASIRRVTMTSATKETADFITEEKLRQVLQTKIVGREIHAFRRIGSTNLFAMRLAREGALEGTLVIAEEQTRGKGRLGRRWESPRGKGLWFSVILRPKTTKAEQASLFSFLAGVSVAQAVEEEVRLHPELKWPNDVLLHGKKFCGILAEAEFEENRLAHLVLGIGVNVNQRAEDFQKELQKTATSLSLVAGKLLDRLPLLARILSELEENYMESQVKGFGEILGRWKARCPHWGKPVTLGGGAEEVRGIFEGLAEDGGLLLRTVGGSLRKVMAGDFKLL